MKIKNSSMKAKEKTHKSEQDILIEGLRKYGRKAYEATLANGVAATVLKGKNICRIEPNGEISIVARLAKAKVKVSNRTFRLK